MTSQDIFGIIAILYCAVNLGSMGFELNFNETIKSLRCSWAVKTKEG
jgi:hypothetical protein